MSTLIIFQANNPAEWKDLFQYGPTVILLALVLWFLLRALPIWKEVKLKELDLRGEENQAKLQQSDALGRLADVLKDIAVEQRRATENIEISQRVNAHSAEQLSVQVGVISKRVDQIEQRVAAVIPPGELTTGARAT